MSYDEERQLNIEIGQAINIAASLIVAKSEKLTVDKMLKQFEQVIPQTYEEIKKARDLLLEKYKKEMVESKKDVKIPLD